MDAAPRVHPHRPQEPCTNVDQGQGKLIIVEREIGSIVEIANMEEIKIGVAWKEVEKEVWIETQTNKTRAGILIEKSEGKINMLKEARDCREILKEEVWKEVRIGGI